MAAGQDQRDQRGDDEHLGGPTPGVDRGAGTTSSRGETDGPTSTGATSTGQGSTTTANPPGTAAEGEEPAGGRPVHATDTSQERPGAVGADPPAQGDPEVSDGDADRPARPLSPGDG